MLSLFIFVIQVKCNIQAFRIQEMEAKLNEEVLHNGELKRQLDEKTATCHHIEVRFHSAISINYVDSLYSTSCACSQVSKE